MKNIFFNLKKLKHLGKGAIIGKTVRIRRPEQTVIGDYSIIDDFAYISCDLEIGSYCHISSNCNIIGGGSKVKFGDFVSLSAGCSVYAKSSNYVKASLDMPSVPDDLRFGSIIGDVMFEDHVLIGAHSVVMPGVRLPEGFAAGAHTVIRKKNYEPWTLYAGFDCRKLLVRQHSELVRCIAEFKRKR